MGNPVTNVARFDGSPDGFEVTGPERYSDGLWLEEATVNAIANPSFETNTTGWASVGGAVLTRITSEHYSGGAACQVATSGSGAQGLLAPTSGPAVGETWTETFRVKGTPGQTVRIMIRDTVSSVAGTFSSQNVVLDGEDNGWDVIPFTRVLADVGTNGCQARLDVADLSTTLIVDAVQLEKKPYATSYTAGTRAASSASVATANHLDPSSGSIAFRITPKIETGVEEIWGEAGTKGSGTDHLRWGRDASTHPFVEWSANDAAYQRLTGTETLSAGTAYDLYLGHTGTVTSLAVDAGTLQTGTRAAVSGDFSTGDLTLEASAGGVIYQPFATFNRTLTAKEIATLNGKNNWTMNVLAGNPYINFQLRPY